MAILPDLSKLSSQDMLALLAKMQAENEALRTANASARPVKCKVTEKGAVSFYGLGQFPVTLYVSQWDILLTHVDLIRQFLKDNAASLTRKPTKGA